MRYLQKVTTTLRSHSYTWHGSSQGEPLIYFLMLPNMNVILKICIDSIMGYFYRDPNLHFVESLALAPPEVQIYLTTQQQ